MHLQRVIKEEGDGALLWEAAEFVLEAAVIVARGENVWLGGAASDGLLLAGRKKETTNHQSNAGTRHDNITHESVSIVRLVLNGRVYARDASALGRLLPIMKRVDVH